MSVSRKCKCGRKIVYSLEDLIRVFYNAGMAVEIDFKPVGQVKKIKVRR